MQVQAKEKSLNICTFNGFNYRNIGPWKGCVNTPDRPFLKRVLLGSYENINKSVLRVCNFNLTAEI